MLRYFVHGYRQINDSFPVNWRTNWEFYAVTSGRVAPTFNTGEQPEPVAQTLWVFAPDCAHGWFARPRRNFHRVVLHFGSVPHPLETFVRAHGNWFAKQLTAAEIVRLRDIAAELAPHFQNPTIVSPLIFQARLLDLAAMILGGDAARQPPSLPELAAFKVDSALSWYGVHLTANPSLKEVSAAIHVSPSHLRRLFWQVRGCSPKAALQKVRLEKAQELMSYSALTLEEVARHCGFAHASHLCREHKARLGFTPTAWRKKIVARFASTPLSDAAASAFEFKARTTERLLTTAH